MKDALLARYSQMRPSVSFIESLKLPPQVLADIWLPVPFPPVSFEPLSEEEQRAVRLGHFGASGKNHRHEHAGSNSGGGAGGSDRYGRRFQTQTAAGGTRDAGSQMRNRQMGQGRTINRREMREEEGFEHRGRHDADDVIEDPDNLWAFPSTPGTSDTSSFGCFDENGVFRAEPMASEPKAVEVPQPQPVPVSVPVEPPAAPSRSAAAPTITPETNWFYRDPSGHFQGPFSSVRMFDWYNGGYFPESLPLRREQDAFFEPLSVWKMKCNGQIPFSAYSKAPAVPAAPAVQADGKDLFSGLRAVEEVFSLRQAPKPAAAEKVHPETVPSSAPRSVAVEALFGGVRAVSPAVQMPASSATAKTLQQPAANYTPLQQIEEEMAAKLKVSSVQPASEPLQQRSWSIPSSTAATKPVSLAEIMQQQHQELKSEPAKPIEALLTEEKADLAAATAGWAKISSPTAASLADIIHAESTRAKDEQLRQSSAASLPSSSAKSFADLVRAAGQAGGNIVVAAPPAIPVTPTTLAPLAASAQPITRKPASISDNASASVSGEVKASAALRNEGPSTEEWCLQALTRSPLGQDIDPATCSTLLLELPSASAILAFAAENLQPLLSREKVFDLAGFSSELATRKFGKAASASVNWAHLSVASPVLTAKTSASATVSGDFSFETVRRKKK